MLLSVANVYFHRQLRGLFSLTHCLRIYSLLNFDNGHCVWWDLISRFVLIGILAAVRDAEHIVLWRRLVLLFSFFL